MSRHNGHTCVLNRDRIETLAECIEGLWLNKEKGLLMQTYQYAGFDVAVYGSYDTVIIGGGTAGSSAAISAARCGNKTLIVEKEICLGGTAVGALVTPMMESFVTHERNFYLIEERLRVRGVPTRSKQMTEYVWSTAESKARVLEELYLEQGGEVLYEATLVGVIKNKSRIRAIIVLTPGGFMAVEALQFVDATGDAWLSRLAGVPCDHGDDRGFNQMSSLRFEMGGIDIDAYRAYALSLDDDFSPLTEGPFWESAMVVGKGFKLEPLFRRAVQDGVLAERDLVYYQCFSLPGQADCLTFNCPHLSELKDNADPCARSAEIVEARRAIDRLVSFLVGYMPGFEDAYLIRTASVLGVRESWRIRGKYTLSEQDYLARARFEDAVAKGDWYIDVHSATNGLVHMDKFERGEYYEIPYRCLINDTVENMMTIGRCISATFLAQASIRIQPTLIDMGDVAGRVLAASRAAAVPLADFDASGIMEGR